MERTSSEVLLELEAKIDTILGYLKTIDLNNKIILSRLNKDNALAGKVVNPAVPALPVQISALPRVEAFTGALPPSINKNVTSLPIKHPSSGDSLLKDLETQFIEVQNDATKIIPQSGDGKKIPIQQKVLYPDNKVVVLANIEIFDTNKNLIKKTKTNNVGKWNALLEPGAYVVHVFKSGTVDKPSIDRKFEISVPVIDTPIELDVLK